MWTDNWPIWINVTLQAAGGVGGLLGAMAAAGAWVARQTLVTKDEHQELERRMSQAERDHSTLEARLSMVATANQVADLRVGLARVEGDMGALSERVAGQGEVSLRNEKLLRSLHDHLLNGGRAT